MLTDALLPPRDPGSHPREHFTSQPLGSQGEESTGSRSCPVKASGVQAASAKVRTSSRHSSLNRESKMTASSVIIPARPPLFHRRWWPGTPNTGARGWGPQAASQGQAQTSRRHIVTFSRGQRAVHAAGGCCGLREAWVPAFQDVGSVNIPATRKRESGLLRTVHLSPWPRCTVSTLDLDRPRNEVSERLTGLLTV